MAYIAAYSRAYAYIRLRRGESSDGDILLQHRLVSAVFGSPYLIANAARSLALVACSIKYDPLSSQASSNAFYRVPAPLQ